jgi:methionyl-tRNA formyltransferase
MGTPQFAVASLAALIDAGHDVVGVVTAPDREAGRGMKPRASAVKEFAVSKGLPVLQPVNLKAQSFLDELRYLDASLQVVVAFRMLPKSVWDMPLFGTFNLHASLLPDYRGAAPINWAIINGERFTGVTTFFLQEEIDTGDIILQEKIPIGEEETAGELHDKLMDLGAALVVRTAFLVQQGPVLVSPQPQEKLADLHLAPKIFKETCRIDWNRPQRSVHDLIRGLSPYPTAFAVLRMNDDEHAIKIFRSELTMECTDEAPVGAVRTDGRSFFMVRCADAWLSLLELQLAGRRRMDVSEFLKGFNPSGIMV